MNTLEEKLDKLWFEWRERYIASLRDKEIHAGPLTDEQIYKDASRLFRMLEEYIPFHRSEQ